MSDESEEVNGEKTEKIVTTWIRNMFDKHSQLKTRIPAEDTDAAFATHFD